MEWTTHLAAIAVGAAIALLFLGGGGSKTETEPAAAAPPASAAAKKKKKKSKKKKAPAKEEPELAPAPAPKPAVAQPAKEEPKGEPAPEEEPAPVAAPGPAPANGGKKKRSKKKKNGAAAGGTAAAPAPAPAKAAPAPAPKPATGPLQPGEVAEEEWATVPKTTKKKKPAFKKPEAAAPSEEKAAPEASVAVAIDASRVGIIIGPKGATMNAIQEKTGTKLDVNAPKPEEGANQFRPVGRKPKARATVVITEGTPEGVRAAKRAVLELADRGYAALLQAEGFGESSVGVHPRFLSEIFGTGGKVIRAIQTGLDVKLTIPKTDWTPKTMQIGNIEPSVRVGIAGDNPANVKRAKQVIKDICAYHHHPITHPGMIHQEVFVPQEFFHCVIGTRGSEIKHIRGNYRVDVHMPSSESWCATENVVCVGKPNDVERAISYIKLLIERDSEQREQKYSDDAYGDDSYGW